MKRVRVSDHAVPRDSWIDELERDLGQPLALRLLANCGGQERSVPKRPGGSQLEIELGPELAQWLAHRFGGTQLQIPSLRGRQNSDAAGRLRAAILDAGLTDPRRSANDIAAEHGVTTKWVRALRTELRRETGRQPYLPLFDE